MVWTLSAFQKGACCHTKQRHVIELEKKGQVCGVRVCLTTTMFPSFPLLFALASVHSFTFVAATPDPLITPAPTTHDISERDGIAGGPGTPILSTLEYPYTALPEQVYPFPVLRGPQIGYNICNSSTEGPNSLCQTLIVNSIVRFFFVTSLRLSTMSDAFNNLCRTERLLLMGFPYPEWLNRRRGSRGRSLLHSGSWRPSNCSRFYYWCPGW